MAWNLSAATNLERFAVVSGEMVTVRRGFVMVVTGAVLLVDGLLRLEGAVRVG